MESDKIYNMDGLESDKIYNIDCLEGMKHIPDGSIDAIICDLPYGTTANPWDSVIPFDKLWEQYKRIAKPNAAIVLFGQTPFFAQVIMSNVRWFRHEWIWVKEKGLGFLNAQTSPLKAHENIAVFCKDGEKYTYNPQKTKGEPYKHRIARKSANHGLNSDKGYEVKYFDGDRFPLDVVFYEIVRHPEHPTQKPVDLLRYLIRTYSNEGDTILDNCMGSGTTAVACIKEKRHFIGFELNKEYFDKACKRIDAERRQLSLF